MNFRFSISDLAVMLGKSPVTIRSWERKGLIAVPRVGGKRLVTVPDIRELALVVYRAGRISEGRYFTLNEALTILEDLEEDL